MVAISDVVVIAIVIFLLLRSQKLFKRKKNQYQHQSNYKYSNIMKNLTKEEIYLLQDILDLLRLGFEISDLKTGKQKDISDKSKFVLSDDIRKLAFIYTELSKKIRTHSFRLLSFSAKVHNYIAESEHSERVRHSISGLIEDIIKRKSKPAF